MATNQRNKVCKILLSPLNFEEQYRALASWFGENGEWVFRGQANAAWKLENSLERTYKPSLKEEFRMRFAYGKDALRTLFDTEEEFIEAGLWKVENEKIKEYSVELSPADSTLVQCMARMRHDGWPSRLLDATWCPFVALFFAVDSAKDDAKRGIYALRTQPLEDWVKPYKEGLVRQGVLDEKSVNLEFADRVIEDAQSITGLKHRWYFLRMKGNNPRMIAQKGLFVMPLRLGYMQRDLEETLGGAYNPHGLKGISVNEFIHLSDDEKKDIAVILMEFSNPCDEQAHSLLLKKSITRESLLLESSDEQKQ